MTNPVLLTVATLGVEDTQAVGVAAVGEPCNCDVLPIQTDKFPVIVGDGYIVNVLFIATVVSHSFVTDNETV